jgi:hypothetical protein
MSADGIKPQEENSPSTSGIGLLHTQAQRMCHPRWWTSRFTFRRRRVPVSRFYDHREMGFPMSYLQECAICWNGLGARSERRDGNGFAVNMVGAEGSWFSGRDAGLLEGGRFTRERAVFWMAGGLCTNWRAVFLYSGRITSGRFSGGRFSGGRFSGGRFSGRRAVRERRRPKTPRTARASCPRHRHTDEL